MPEGDTIFRTAKVLREVLAGQVISSARADPSFIDGESLIGITITQIESRGKHILFHLADGRSVHSHMGMTGSWNVYGLQTRWRKREQLARLVLTTETHAAVCFTPRQLELLTSDQLRRHPWLSRLGPDLLSSVFDCNSAIERLRVHNRTEIGDAILNQSVVCGIGNVYKSELLFLEELNPFSAVSRFSDQQLRSLLEHAAALLKRNTGHHLRQTRFKSDGPRLWVYRRSGELCLRCGERIAMQRQGDPGRSTYFCPSCQHT